ncbi:MAG: cadherin repeat domain-containing protein [Planctomycetales bacterium]|nr:cadherin repeat domain-containing protein [Planctomycetales bacterium]
MFKNMSPRERMLALIVGISLPVLLIPLLGYQAYQSLRGTKGLIKAQQDQKDQLELNQQRWMRAEQRRNELRRFSLASNVQQGRAAYRDWLLQQATEIFGDDVNLDHRSDVTRKSGNQDVYTESSFLLTADRSTLGQLVEFLETFESLDCLHRIRRMTVKPLTDLQNQTPSKELDLNFEIDVLSVAGSDPRESLTEPIESEMFDLAGYSAEARKEWRDDILRRNVFGPPNNAPRLSSSGTRRFTEGDDIELTISARDEDDGDLLSFELVDSPMAGVRIEPDRDGRSATLVVPADLAVGRYQFTVAVTDDGFPAKTDQGQVSIEIEEREQPPAPDPPEPEFDVAIASYVTGVVRDRDGVWRVFIDNKPKGELLELTIGDEFEVGSVSGVVLDLAPGRATFEIEGEFVDFRPGQVLKNETRPSSGSSRRRF